jgi:hypothetical protein
VSARAGCIGNSSSGETSINATMHHGSAPPKLLFGPLDRKLPELALV